MQAIHPCDLGIYEPSPTAWSGKEAQMNNRISLILGIIIVVLILLDVTFNSSNAITFLLRKLVDLIEYLAFWR